MLLLAPTHTRRLATTAEAFCILYCREEDEACPLDTGPDSCPLWRFVEADLPTRVREDLLDWLDGDQVVN
jgi:hypothetical protein